MKSIAIACLALSSITANAEFRDGNKLLSELNGQFSDKMFAIGYVAGAIDVLSGVTVCAPSNLTLGQATDMIKQYLEQFPADRHNSADRIINHVLKAAWPCAKKGQAL